MSDCCLLILKSCVDKSWYWPLLLIIFTEPWMLFNDLQTRKNSVLRGSKWNETVLTAIWMIPPSDMLMSLYDSVLPDIFSPKWPFIASCTVSYGYATEVSTNRNGLIGLTWISDIFSLDIFIFTAREKSQSACPCGLGIQGCVSWLSDGTMYLVSSPEPSETCQIHTCDLHHQDWNGNPHHQDWNGIGVFGEPWVCT